MTGDWYYQNRQTTDWYYTDTVAYSGFQATYQPIRRERFILLSWKCDWCACENKPNEGVCPHCGAPKGKGKETFRTEEY